MEESMPKAAGNTKANSGFMKPMQPSEDLAKIVGSQPLPRSEVTKKIWAHIKKNKLQNPTNKREILADEKLQPIFGGKKLDMFQMTKAVNKHLKWTAHMVEERFDTLAHPGWPVPGLHMLLLHLGYAAHKSVMTRERVRPSLALISPPFEIFQTAGSALAMAAKREGLLLP
jgi:upstream activation factor subunit UAF30